MSYRPLFGFLFMILFTVFGAWQDPFMERIPYLLYFSVLGLWFILLLLIIYEDKEKEEEEE